ncbi:MAG: hypothetical protein EOP38_23680 [Rubrivivax sp.]|nr:MAG: hypothetical protein EOP38_23680 [Rubrivivax sp.]
MLVLPWFWWSKHLLPAGLGLHLSGACLLVLMFGWPLAIMSLLLVGLGSALIDVGMAQHGQAFQWSQAALALASRFNDTLVHTVWVGLLPATLGLGLGMATRRWLPRHLFVYILARGFIGTALAVFISSALALWVQHPPDAMTLPDRLLGQWLLSWGEAVSTGMLTAVFVAFKPAWLLTYSHERYVPPPAG